MTDFLNKVKDKIKEHEGFRDRPYDDHLGNLTIGYGTLIEKIPEELANVMFEFWFNKGIEELRDSFPWFYSAPRNIVEALINMHYNMGINRLKQFKKMLAAMEVKDYDVAATEALDSRWAMQVGRRSLDIAKLIRTAE